MFTDIEGSTKLLELLRERYALVLEQQRDILRAAFARHAGREVDTQGDSFFVAFASAAEALACAVEIQRELAAHDWPDGIQLKVRIGVHTGQPAVAASGYVGIDVHRGARIGAAAHGGQVLASSTTSEAAAEAMPADVELASLGIFRFKGIADPLAVFEVRAPGLTSEFPPIRTSPPEDEPPAMGEPPYKGLLRFEEEDAERFFGREELVAQIVDAVKSEPFLAIVGASGSGKSSLIRAGVIPVLKARADTTTAVMTPTADPLSELNASLAVKPDALVVDQFEELFTLCREEHARQLFVERLMAALNHGLHVLVTLRADFYASVGEYPALRDAVADHQLYIGPMDTAGLRRAIEEPARQGGWEIAPGLVDLLLRDVGSEPGALPLLSHALLETWSRRRGSRMTLKGYFESGEVRGAIAKTADRVYAELSPSEQPAAREILLRLTELGEGTQDTRRRARIDELVGDGDDDSDPNSVLRRLVDARLVTVDEGSAEVAHEALIREWPLLRTWLQEDREGLRTQRQITEAAAEWEMLNREPSLLFRGARLATAHEWADAHPASITPRERAFIDASIHAEEADASEREAQQQRALDAERRRAEEQVAANRRLRRRAFVLAGAVVLAAAFAGVAVLAGLQATDNARLARARELSATATAWQARDPELSVLIAMRALDEARTPDALMVLRDSISASMVRARYTGHEGPVWSATYTHNGQRALSASSDGTVRVWDATSHAEMRQLNPQTGEPVRAASSPDDSLIAAGGTDGWLWVWRSEDGALVSHVQAHADRITDVDFAPDGGRILTTSFDGTASMWDVATMKQVRSVPAEAAGPIWSGTFSPDGTRFVTAGEDRVAHVWDMASGAELLKLVGHTDTVFDVAYSADGRQIITGGLDTTARIWDATTGAATRVLRGHTGAVDGAAFAGDSMLVATASSDGTVRVWDPASGEHRRTLPGHKGGVAAVAFRPDGKALITAGRDGTLREWARQSDEPLVTFAGHVGSVNDVDFSADGTKVVTAGGDRSARIYDAADGTERTVLMGHEGFVFTAQFSPDGARVLTGSGDGTARIWDAATGAVQRVLAGHSGNILSAAYDRTGTRIVTASDDGTVATWDAAAGERNLSVDVGEAVAAAVFSFDGTRFYSGAESGAITIWDTATGGTVGTLSGHEATVRSLALSPDGTRLASAAEDGTIRIHSLGDNRTIFELRGGTGNPWRARFSPDGSRIVSGGDDGAAHVWDASSGARLADIHVPSNDVFSATFAPDNRHVLVSHRDSAAILIDCVLCGDTDSVLALARTRVTRALTSEELITILHESSAGTAPGATPSAEPLEPRAPLQSPDQPLPSLSPGDICTLQTGPCDLAPGVYTPSIFRPHVRFELPLAIQAIWQSGRTIVLANADFEIVLASGAPLLGAHEDAAVAIPPSPRGFVDYLRSKPWLEVSNETTVTVGGKAGLQVDTHSLASDLPTVFFTEPGYFFASPGERDRITAIDVDGTTLIIIAALLNEDHREAMYRANDAILRSLTFPLDGQ